MLLIETQYLIVHLKTLHSPMWIIVLGIHYFQKSWDHYVTCCEITRASDQYHTEPSADIGNPNYLTS